ncbi:MAG: hypothetical protein AAF849_11935 [Bacteroidota bacterium]
MPYQQSTYHSKLYCAFYEIDSSDYRTQVRFFEERTERIEQLEEEEYFELMFSYMHALFEVGMYAKYLQKVSRVLEITIENNIGIFHGKDLFCELLFQKSASHYQMMEYAQAEHTARELIKINPDYTDISTLLKKILRKSYPQFNKIIQATSVLLFIISAIVIAIEIFYLRPFYPELVSVVEMTRIVLLTSGILVYLLGELFLVYRSERMVKQFVQEVKQKKGYHKSSI